MDNSNIYYYTLKRFTRHIEHFNNAKSEDKSNLSEDAQYIWDLGDEKYKVYNSIVENNQASGLIVIRKMLIMLLSQNKIEFDYYEAGNTEQSRMRLENPTAIPVAFIVPENGKKVGYIISDRYNTKAILSEGKVDSLCIMHLKMYSERTYKCLIDDVNLEHQKKRDSVVEITIEDFFVKFFGENEFGVFLYYLASFNKNIKSIIEFNTVTRPTENALKKFRQNTMAELKEWDYLSHLPSDRNAEKLEDVIKNYIDKEMYRALVGTADFAIGFISSEWNYKMYELTENLDLTGVVAGYLKSVEQLLFLLACLFYEKGENVKLSIEKNNKKHKFTTVYEYDKQNGKRTEYHYVDGVRNDNQTKERTTNGIAISTTLGWLENFIKDNTKLTIIDFDSCEIIRKIIGDWRSHERNGYFHKDLIRSSGKVDEIRDETRLIHALILGSIILSKDDYFELGIQMECEEEKSFEEYYYNFEKWMDAIVEYVDVQNGDKAFCLEIYAEDDYWCVRVNTKSSYYKDDAKWIINEGLFCSDYDLFYVEKSKTSAEVNMLVVKLAQHYLCSSTCGDKLKEYEAFAVLGANISDITLID